MHGPTFCYAKSYFDRKFTERPFVSDTDYQSGGNETLAQVLNPAPLGPTAPAAVAVCSPT